MSNRAEEKAMLVKKLQEELDRRTELEEEAIYLMEQGEFERANQLLKSIDDSVAKGIMEELDQLNGLEEEETKEELQGTVNAILESGTVNLVLKGGEKNTMKQPTIKELDEIVQAIVREYLGNVKEYADGTKGATPFHQKESVLGAIEVFNSYSQMVVTDDYKLDRLQIYNQTIQTLENAKKEEEKSLSEIQINYADDHAFVPRDVIADNIINYFKNCKCSVSDAWEVTKIVRDRLHTQAYKEQIK